MNPRNAPNTKRPGWTLNGRPMYNPKAPNKNIKDIKKLFGNKFTNADVMRIYKELERNYKTIKNLENLRNMKNAALRMVRESAKYVPSKNSRFVRKRTPPRPGR
jgi:hypothetical protein